MKLSKFIDRARSKSTSAPASKKWIAVCFKLKRGGFGSDDEREAIRSFAHELEAEVQRVILEHTMAMNTVAERLAFIFVAPMQIGCLLLLSPSCIVVRHQRAAM